MFLVVESNSWYPSRIEESAVVLKFIVELRDSSIPRVKIAEVVEATALVAASNSLAPIIRSFPLSPISTTEYV